MPDYSKGQIYKIVDVGFNKCYIGSTVEKLSVRMSKHKHHYKMYLEGRKSNSTVFSLFKEYVADNCKIYWLENYPSTSKKELETREGFYIQNTECINRYIAGRTKEQYVKDNPEIIRMAVKKYKQNNPEKVKENRKLQYERKSKIIYNCSCGGTYGYFHKARHEKSKKHQQFINQNNPQEPTTDQS